MPQATTSRNFAPRRVILLDHTAALGGGEIALLNLVQALDAGRYQAVVLLFADGPLVGRLKEAGCDVRIVPLDASVADTRKDSLGAGSVLAPGKMWKSWRFIWRLRRELRQLAPAIIHCNSLKSDILGGIAGRLARQPVVWHVRDRIVPEYLPGKVVRVFRRLCRWVPRYVVAISEATLETLCLPRSFVEGGRRACIVHDGVACASIDEQTKGQGDQDRGGGEMPRGLRIGIVGRISPWKGQHIFLEAAARVRQEFPDARFLIIGAALFDEAAYEKQLQELTDRLALRDAVEFTGFRPDVPALLASLDILVHASTIGEPFGQVVAEGMAAGKPVVATGGGGVPEIIVDGESGLLASMGSVDEMAAALLRLCRDPALRAQLGAAGRRRIEEKFTIQRTAAGVMAVWDRLG